ncbi:MAG: hypothetical protein KKH98_00960 [Spirochaetes bacterium]|nr:hypothetical protein [Spirochaetota bacterium]
MSYNFTVIKKNMKTYKVILCFLLILIHSTLFGMTDEDFLLMVQQNAVGFFWNETSTNTGVVKDRAVNTLYEEDGYVNGSIASTGFGLTAICIAHSHGWLTYEQAYNRILKTLKFFKDTAARKNGFYNHFINIYTGENSGSELSSIDTTILMCGVLFAGQYFRGTEVESMANELYLLIDWYWMCNGDKFVNMGWNSGGFLTAEWANYDEGLLLDVLATGSPTHPPYDSPKCWTDMSRTEVTVGPGVGYTFIRCSGANNTLFIHQFPQCWVDLRKRSVNGTNYYTNSKYATLHNIWYCSNTAGYPENYWGLSASDAPPPRNYTNYGPGPPTVATDGTIAVYGPGASTMFTPKESTEALKYIYNNYQGQIWGKYGFSDALNVSKSWYDDEVIGIDQGAMILSIENYLTGMVWDEFMKIGYILNGLSAMGFTADSDVTRPDTITDLKVFGNRIEWSAPSDSGSRVKKYYIRYLTRPVTNPADWYEAKEISHTLVPQAPGTKETLMVDTLPPGTYYFAVKSEDDAGNKSLLSNSTVSAVINRISNKLLQSFPNPFNLNEHNTLTLRYVLKEARSVKVKLASLSGKVVKEWDRGEEAGGYHQVDWDGKENSGNMIEPGIYVMILEVDGKTIGENTIMVVK